MSKLFEFVLEQLDLLEAADKSIDKSLITWALTLIASAFDVIVSSWLNHLKIFLIIFPIFLILIFN